MLKTLVTRLTSQSDLTHNSLAAAASAATLPMISGLSPAPLATLHLTSISAALGTQLYVGFVAGPTMFMNMERHAFGNIQARLFPKMGMVTVGSNIISLGTYCVAHSNHDMATALLVTSLALNSLNSFFVFNWCTQLMFELRKHEVGSEQRKIAGKRFGMAHGISVLVNLASMASVLGYLYIMSTRIAGLW